MMAVNLRDIPGYDGFASIDPILEGVSGEDKYRVTTLKGERLFLRVGVCADSYENHKKHMRAETLDIKIARTVGFGLFDDNRHYYWLLTWLDGVSAFDVLPAFDKVGQYDLGVKTGKLLKKIHSIPVLEEMEPLYEWLGRNIDFFIGERRSEHIGNSELYINIVTFLENNKMILHVRPQVFLHGDFGLSNLIITPGGEVIPTDFSYNMRSYGDPCSDMANFSERGATTPYMSGQIHGYFDGEIPEDFWRAYLFHEAFAALVILSARETREWIGYLCNWYNERIQCTVNVVPKWYMTTV